jgi:tetratricopeptide (TPR) repeat protein
MTLKSDLLKFLSRMPNSDDDGWRQALGTITGVDGLIRQISSGKTPYTFFDELLKLLIFEGKNTLISFLRSLANSDFLGVDSKNSLDQLIRILQSLTNDEWDREFFGVSKTKASSHIPFYLWEENTPHFTGREEELQQLEALLLNSQGSKVCSIVGISGGGGIGKSTLARQFAKIYRDKFPDGVIGLRVDGKDVDTIASDFVRRCGEKLDSEDDRDAATLMQDVFAKRQMLLIFDNAEEASIKKLRPGGTRCAVIVTTRKRNLPFSLDIGEQQTIDLAPLPEADALKLLKKFLGSERVDSAVMATKRLVKLVGNLPLALHVLGAALRGQREPLDNYAKALEEEKDELFEELKIDGDRDLNVEASLNLSLKSLAEDEIVFFACLSVCAAEGFTKQTAMAATGCERNLQAQRRLKQLYDLSLLNYVETGENRFVLHPLVRVYAGALAQKRGLLAVAQERHAKFFVDWLQSNELKDEITIAQVAADLDDVILAAQWLQNHEADTEQSKIKTYQFTLKLQPLFEQYGYWQKAITLMARFQSLAEQFEDWNAVVRYKMHEARYWSFAEEFERAEAILHSAQTNLQKIEALDTRKMREAKLLNVLAGIFQKQDKKEEAIQTFRDEILIEKEIGDDRSLAIICNRLGKLLQSQDKLEEAQHFFEQGILINEAINDLFSLSIGFNCLGGLLQEQGKLGEAQQAFEREIVIDEVLNDQPKLAITLNRLGGLLQQQGKLDKAQQVFERGIAIAEDINDQSSVAIGLNCLGRLFQQQDQLEKAQQAFERQIAITEGINNQSSLAIGLNCLGRLFQQQGQLEEAEQAFKRGIVINEVINDKSQLAIGLNRLGGLLQQQGQLEEAQQAFERGIAIARGLNDQSQLSIGLNCLVGLLQQQGKLEEAQQAFKQEIAIAEALNDQLSLAIGLKRLGMFLEQQGKLEDAQQAVEQQIEIIKVLKNQSQLAITLNHLGGLLQQQGKLEDAQEIFEREIDIARVFNQEFQVGIGLNSLGGLLLQQGKLGQAQQVLEQSIAIAQTLNDQSALIARFKLLCRLLQQQGKLQEVLEKSQAIFTHLNVCTQVAWVWYSLGRAWKLKGEFEEAEKLLKLSQDFFENEKDWPSLAKVLNTLGGVLERRQKWDEAEKILRQSYDLAVKLNDKRGQAIVANSLGQVIAKQKGNEAFENSQMYFRQSIKLGEELDDQNHLAKVHTAMGQALLAHNFFDRAVEELSKGFEIDERLSNVRGLRIVTPNLTYALSKLRKQEKALEYCDRALKIAPNYPGFLQLHDKIQTAIATGIQQRLIKTGLILYIRRNEGDNSRWGKIAPDDGTSNVTFNEKFIGYETISKLIQGTLVEVEVKENYGKLYATQIRVIEKE